MKHNIPTAANGWNDGTEHSARRDKVGKFLIEYLPEGYILLNKELATGFHPKLYEVLGKIPVNELDERLSAIALYCGVILDGFYTIQERSVLAATLAGRLEILRDIGKKVD